MGISSSILRGWPGTLDCVHQQDIRGFGVVHIVRIGPGREKPGMHMRLRPRLAPTEPDTGGGADPQVPAKSADDRRRSCPAGAEHAARVQPLRDQVSDARRPVPALRDELRGPAGPRQPRRRRRLRRVERLLRHPTAAVLLGEDRGPAVPAQAADAPLRRPVHVDDDTTVFVEIKQRVNRVTQKRRVALPYRLARGCCATAGRWSRTSPASARFVEEVLGLRAGLDLRPVAMTGYQREAFVGRDADARPAGHPRPPRPRPGPRLPPRRGRREPADRPGPAGGAWSSRPTSGCRTG